MTAENNTQKWIFVGIILLIIAVLVFSNEEGKSKDEQYLADYNIDKNATDNVNQENYDVALNDFQRLLDNPEYKDSITLNWKVAIVLSLKGEYRESLKYYDKIKHDDPAILLDQNFLKEYGELLTKLNDEHASIYLKRVKS